MNSVELEIPVKAGLAQPFAVARKTAAQMVKYAILRA
jgi:hypothetical protein